MPQLEGFLCTLNCFQVGLESITGSMLSIYFSDDVPSSTSDATDCRFLATR